MKVLASTDPTVVRYAEFFDPGILVNFIANTMPDNAALSIKSLREKLVVLLRLALCSRSMDLAKIELAFSTWELQETPKVHLALLELKNGASLIETLTAFPDARICPVRALSAYLERTADVRAQRRHLEAGSNVPLPPNSIAVAPGPVFVDGSPRANVSQAPDPVNQAPNTEIAQETAPTPIPANPARPRRARRSPARLDDYEIYDTPALRGNSSPVPTAPPSPPSPCGSPG